MAQMTSHERFRRVFAHEAPDRVPIIDDPWGATIERWRREGMPADVGYVDYFGLDRVAAVGLDNSPRFPVEVVEETEEYRIHRTAWGATLKDWKHAASTPEFLDFTLVDRDAWEHARTRMQPDDDRIDWSRLEHDAPRWEAEGWWVQAGLWFGFDVTHSWMVGTERLLMALVEEPEWCRSMFEAQLDLDLALLQKILDRGYRIDAVRWPDDMGYKHNQFFSVDTYRRLLKPYHQRAIDWAHERGIVAHLHSCGDVNPFVPELASIGLDALNPLEVKAGMDVVALKREWGDRLVLHGGINAVLWDRPEEIRAEIERVLPVVKEGGGYIFSSDHSVPSSVGLDDFRGIVEHARRLGSYD
jgi:uroporphyrinogen decarboxylase